MSPLRWSLCWVFVPLAGCGSSGDEELRQWMEAQYNSSKPQVQEVIPPAPFVPQPYEMAQRSDPFGPERTTAVMQGARAAPATSSALLRSEQQRRKEPLEAFALDQMTMVGTLDRRGQRVALVKVAGILHQVRVGSYLGPNYGRVIQISEGDLTLREIVQETVDEWSERVTKLQLLEESSR